MTDEDDARTTRLERALDLAPAAAPEVEGLGIEARDDFARAATVASQLPPPVVDALAQLSDAECQDLLDRRFLVAGLEQGFLEQLDGALLDSSNAGVLPGAALVFGELLQTKLPALAVMEFEEWVQDQMHA